MRAELAAEGSELQLALAKAREELNEERSRNRQLGDQLAEHSAKLGEAVQQIRERDRHIESLQVRRARSGPTLTVAPSPAAVSCAV